MTVGRTVLTNGIKWIVFNVADKPKILKIGKTDKLIKDYLEIYEKFKDF